VRLGRFALLTSGLRLVDFQDEETCVTKQDREIVSEILKRHVIEIRKIFDESQSEVSVDDIQHAMTVQIILVAQDLDVAFDENDFVIAVRGAAEGPMRS